MVHAYGILFEYRWFCRVLEVDFRDSDCYHYTFILYKSLVKELLLSYCTFIAYQISLYLEV